MRCVCVLHTTLFAHKVSSNASMRKSFAKTAFIIICNSATINKLHRFFTALRHGAQTTNFLLAQLKPQKCT
jgi:hypothetical protein